MAVLDAPAIRKIPGVNLDDRLRMVPGFSLFRRSSGMVAHPTTQGVSLRGIGSSGASRTLILWDGIPVNDPFGGWVYWTRIDPDELSRVEVTRGASTSVFGDRAMTGAVALFSRTPERCRLTGGYEFGNRNTHQAVLGYSHLWPRFAVSGQGRAFTTNGYYIVPEVNRGPVDREAGVRFVAGDVRLDYIGASQRLFLKADVLSEERENGTQLQRNSSGMGTLAANYFREWRRDTLSVLGYHTREEFRSSFSTILAGRLRETISFLQTVPSEAVGGAAFWRHSGGWFNSLVGADAQRVEGRSIERFPAITRVGAGDQLQHGTFVQGDARFGPVRFYAGARHHFPSPDRQFFSPSFGLSVGRGRWRGRGSVYRSFRAPTLNELYREFRQGNAVTQANAFLKPERIFGAEFGFDWVGEHGRFGATFFRNELKDLVTNVTLRSTPAEIIRQRQNAAEAHTRGVEIDVRRSFGPVLGEASYLYADPVFSTRLRIPQIPRHQGSAQVSWLGRRTLASIGVRSTASQFDDDLNRFLLPGFATAQISVRHQLWKSLAVVGAFENILDRVYYSAFTPIPQTGPPRQWRAGLRWDGKLW